jgi:hypothetical protein
MTRFRDSVIFAVLLWLLLGSAPAAAQGKWEVLFDGQATDAWRGYKRADFPAKGWAVEGGTLKTIVGGDRADLVTRKKYRDFELELEWRVAPGGNSGVFYRVSEEFQEVWHTGPEVQVLDDDRHRDGKNPKTSAGSLYALLAPAGKVLKPVGEFNRMRIIARGRHVEHWLNGKKVVEYELGSESLKGLILESKFKDLPRFAQEPEGHIALQHHGEEVWYRNIRVRPLAAK